MAVGFPWVAQLVEAHQSSWLGVVLPFLCLTIGLTNAFSAVHRLRETRDPALRYRVVISLALSASGALALGASFLALLVKSSMALTDWAALHGVLAVVVGGLALEPPLTDWQKARRRAYWTLTIRKQLPAAAGVGLLAAAVSQLHDLLTNGVLFFLAIGFGALIMAWQQKKIEAQLNAEFGKTEPPSSHNPPDERSPMGHHGQPL